MLRSRDDATARARPTLAGLLVVVALSLVLLAESLVPGRALVPLVADDFEAWGAGKDPADLRGHPHPNWCMSDVLHLLAPGFAVTAGAVQRGELPLWDATQALGLPHLHQVHHGLLYPPAWIVVLLGWRGLAWTAWLHAVLAGLGMLVYLQSVGRTRTAALTGAIAFMLSAWVTARLQSVPVVGAAVWLPWVLAGLERGAQTGRLRPYLGAAAALALSFLAGFPQVTLWIATLAALVELVRAVVRRRKGHRWAAPLLRGAAALAGGAALALPQLLPTLDYLVHDSQRSTQTSEQVAQTGLETPLLWQLLVPDRYATTTLTGAHPLALLD
ncbi:MAG TPA: YfhO family protein, partial [Planctomycetota bacterium]|nr:YfhO family protein [Planctomycetota bacterium]